MKSCLVFSLHLNAVTLLPIYLGWPCYDLPGTFHISIPVLRLQADHKHLLVKDGVVFLFLYSAVMRQHTEITGPNDLKVMGKEEQGRKTAR